MTESSIPETTPEPRLYRARAEVLNLDANPDLDLSEAALMYENPLPVFDASKRIIGAATLVRLEGYPYTRQDVNMAGQVCGIFETNEPNKLVADLVFDYATPERLELQVESVLYAHPRGAYCFDGHPRPIEDPRPTLKVASVEITGITLSAARPIDGRIHRVEAREV